MTRTASIKVLRNITLIGVYGGLLMPLAFFPVVIFPFVFSKLLFLQMLIGLTFPAYLILAWVEPMYRPKRHVLFYAIFAYFVAVALSVVFAVDPIRAWWGNQERMNGLFTLLHFLAWLLMAVSVIRTWEQWKKILIFEVCVSAVMASVALLQKPFPKLLSFPAAERVGGLLDNPIYMAAYQIFNLFFILLLWLKGVSTKTKIWLGVFVLLDVGAFFAAQSRGALVGLAAGIVVFAVVYAVMSKSKKTRISVISAAVLFFALYGALFAARNTDIVKNSPLVRLTNFQVTTKTRFIAWQIAWKGFLERPLTGWGFDDFHILFNLKYNPQSLESGYYETWFDRAHNTVMDALSMTGILGTVTFFGIFGALFYSVIRARRKDWIDNPTAGVLLALPVAYFVQNLFVFDQPAGFTMSFLLYALVIRATSPDFFVNAEKTPSIEGSPAKQKTVPWTAFVILQVLGIVLVWQTSVLPARASILSIKSNNYFSAGMYADAYQYAVEAASIPTPYTDEQTFLQSRNLISLVDNGQIDKVSNWKAWHDLIVDISKKHLAEHPRNTHPHFIFARFLQSFDKLVPEDAALAEEQYLAAIKTSPERQQLLTSIARFYLEQGKKQEGLAMFQKAADADPNVGESRWFVGVTLMFDMNRREEGAKEMAAAMTVKAPYQLKNVQDAVILGKAYEILNDGGKFVEMLNQVQTLGGGSVQLFVELARSAEHLNLIAQRDLILKAVAKADAGAASRLAPLLETKTATSIDAALKQTELIQVAAPPAPLPETAVTSTPSTGPRK